MYEMLGLSVSNFAEVTSEPTHIESENENDFEEIPQDPDDAIDYSSSDESMHVNNYNNELVQKDNTISPLKNIDEYQEDSNEPQLPKRPFLKRGAGLTSRFRIAPDAFNLKKLPRYKYADRVKKNLARASNSRSQEPEPPPPRRKSTDDAKKKSSPGNVPAPSVSNTKLEAPRNVALTIPKEPLPPAKPTTQVQEWFESRVKEPEIVETPKVAKLPKGVSWAQILSSNNIMDSPVNIDHLLNPSKQLENYPDMNDTSLFHLLEERVNNMNIDTSMSSIMKLVASLQKPQSSQDEDRTLVNPEDPIIDDAKSVNLQLEPHPSEIHQEVQIDTTDNDESDEIDHHVRFCNNIEVVGDTTDLSTDLDAIELTQTSTPNERQKFHEFKKRLMGHQHKPEERFDDLKEKSSLLRGKLEELEAEMSSLRQQNANILKVRQELALDRLQLENDREDMMEKMKDDRIKMELQLHDERLKIEQEKQKLDKMLKTPSKKEREEIVKLKETIEDLKEEVKTKEARHGSASARYRSQIKQLEKENQTFKLELDAVRKDNKKLEVENARLRKDTNSKMLQEINRNIAKLAPAETKKQPEAAKKPVVRRSEPALKKRVKSVPELHSKSTSESSDDEQVTKSRPYQSKENNPVRTRRSDPPRITPTPTPSEVLAEMKREIINSDGSKDIWYPNGNLKKISPDGMLIRMLYFNKDIKETNINEGTVKYYYNETNTWHTTYIDGLEILEYPE